MEKQLFAKTQAAKFLTLLAATLAMFTACNFVGGEDARKTIGGINSTYVDPKGFFKSLEGTSPQIWENTFSTNDHSAILAGSQGWWGGGHGDCSTMARPSTVTLTCKMYPMPLVT